MPAGHSSSAQNDFTPKAGVHPRGLLPPRIPTLSEQLLSSKRRSDQLGPDGIVGTGVDVGDGVGVGRMHGQPLWDGA